MVPDRAQISSSRCQSALFLASRDTSRPSTIPARPMLTSATRRWKPSRSVSLAPDGVDDHDLLGGPAQRDRPAAQVVLAVGGLGVGEHLPQGGLAHVFSEL